MRVNSTLTDIQQPIQCLEIKFLKFFITYNLSFAIFLIVNSKKTSYTHFYHIAKCFYCTRHLFEKRTLKDIERHYGKMKL